MKGQLLLALVLVVGVFLIAVSQVFGSNTITVKQSNVEPRGRGCVDGEWHLVINQIASESLAPSVVDVMFSDGHTHTKALSKFTGKVAHYFIFDHLTDTLVTATIDIYDGWTGQFVVSHAPCVETSTPTPTPPVCIPEEDPCVTPTPTSTPIPTATSTASPISTPSSSATPTPTMTPVAETIPTFTSTPPTTPPTLEIPSALPNTGGEGSGGGVINWLAIVGVFLMLIGIGALISSALRK